MNGLTWYATSEYRGFILYVADQAGSLEAIWLDAHNMTAVSHAAIAMPMLASFSYGKDQLRLETLLPEHQCAWSSALEPSQMVKVSGPTAYD